MAWLLVSATALADLQAPAWYNNNAPGSVSDWHYRVPISIPAIARPNHTIRMDVDFGQLLSSVGSSGTFDVNSARVVRSNGALCALQQYTDTIYGGVTDTSGRSDVGEIRFIMEDNGGSDYYLYCDIVQNGAKSAWPAARTINGNFEFLDGSRTSPPGWFGNAYSSVRGQAETIDNQTINVRPGYGDPRRVRTVENGHSGNRCYLMGVRDREEVNSGGAALTSELTRTIPLPAGDQGVLRLRYRIKGWDGSDFGQSIWDYLNIFANGSELVGPNALNPDYGLRPFSPNLGTGAGSAGNPGYGLYNGFASGIASAPPANVEPWFDIVYDLSGQNSVDLRIETHNYYQYRSWFHIDDVEWSVLDNADGVALGAAQVFGVNVTGPNDTAAPQPATIYFEGDTLSIEARVDARPSNVTADVVDPDSALVAANITLYNDGSHGDAVAGDDIWTNDGVTDAPPTYVFLSGDTHGTDWQVVVSAASAGVTATDAQVFTLAAAANISVAKTAATFSDPYNDEVDPRNIPGALVTYTITVENSGGAAVDEDSVVVIDSLPAESDLFVGNPLLANGPVTFTDGSVSCGLGFDPSTDLSFSTNGTTWTTGLGGLPSNAPLGVDPAIRYIRMNPKGNFNGANGGNPASFTLTFRVRVQ